MYLFIHLIENHYKKYAHLPGIFDRDINPWQISQGLSQGNPWQNDIWEGWDHLHLHRGLSLAKIQKPWQKKEREMNFKTACCFHTAKHTGMPSFSVKLTESSHKSTRHDHALQKAVRPRRDRGVTPRKWLAAPGKKESLLS